MSMELLKSESEIAIAKSLNEAKATKEAIPIQEITGVILCGGLGSRLRSITHDKIIKPLLPIAHNQVLIDNSLTNMRRAGIRDIYFITTEYAVGKLKKHTRDNRGKYDNIHFFVDDQFPAGTIPVLKKFIKETNLQKPLIKANGDEVYTFVDVHKLYESHTRKQQFVTGLLTDNKESTGKYKMWIDESCRVTRMQEQPFLPSIDATGYYETGLWIIDPSQFPLVQEANSWSDLLKKATERRKLYGYPASIEIFNVNTPTDLEKAQRRMQYLKLV